MTTAPQDELMLIGSLSRRTGLSLVTLRKYEKLGLLSPAHDSSGRRIYLGSDVARALEAREELNRKRLNQTK